GTSVIVGINRFVTEDGGGVPVLEIDPALEEDQKRRLAGWRAGRDQGAVDAALTGLQTQAATDSNLLPAMKTALATGATVGEVSDLLRAVFGVHRPG
ncbi:MAG: methylmalonyl-CoA mutase family protein, partial [Acidimicrobiia bacterium]